MKKSLLIGLIVTTISFGTFSQTLDEIVAKHIEAIGGKANWDKIKSLKLAGLIKADGSELHINIFLVDKKAMRTNIDVMGMSGYSIVTTTEGWNYMPFAGQTKPEPMTADDIKNSQDYLSVKDEFLTYAEQGKKIELLDKDDVDGVECFKIKMTDKNAKETTFYIDPSNYYIIKQTMKIKSDGKEEESSVTYGNYKKAEEGIVYPMSEVENGEETQFEKVEINPTIDESLFKLPK